MVNLYIHFNLPPFLPQLSYLQFYLQSNTFICGKFICNLIYLILSQFIFISNLPPIELPPILPPIKHLNIYGKFVCNLIYSSSLSQFIFISNLPPIKLSPILPPIKHLNIYGKFICILIYLHFCPS